MKNHKSNTSILKSFYFMAMVIMICISYLCFELSFIPHEILTADEFVFARHIHDYTFHLPYRDFAPYKTVLGYYLLSIPMFFSHAILAPLFYMKDEIAILNVIAMIICSVWASRFFDKKAVLLALLAIIANQHFLMYGSELRVDMLTSWFCLFAALAVLQNSMRLGGVLLAISFLISQKALWYFLAINGGMLYCRLSLGTKGYSLRQFIQFNLATAIPIIIYMIGWSIVSSPSMVMHNLFYEGYIQANISWYQPIYISCWLVILGDGPLLFLLWPFTFIRINEKVTDTNADKKHLFILGVSAIALILLIDYKQPFPYNFVFTIPGFFLLYADFISWLIKKNNHHAVTKPASVVIQCIAVFYAIAILYLVTLLTLPLIYTLITLLPVLIYQFLYPVSLLRKKFSLSLMLIIFLIAGIIYPLYQSIHISPILDGRYQQTIIKIMDDLTDNNSKYVGGIPFLYQKDQPINGVKNLIGPQIAYLSEPDKEIESLLLSSIYLAPTTNQKLIHDFENSSVKLIVTNYRIIVLPNVVKKYLMENYNHFYGSIYLYSPTIHPTQAMFKLKFTAPYRINATHKLNVLIDGKKYASGKILNLHKGIHHTKANATYRLDLVPPLNKSTFNPAYQWDFSLYMTKAILG